MDLFGFTYMYTFPEDILQFINIDASGAITKQLLMFTDRAFEL